MAKPKFRPPSRVDSLAFPVFGLTWYGTPSSGGTGGKNIGCSVIAYCGGGGSAKTGVGNKIVVDVTTDDPEFPGSSVSRKVEISTGEMLCFGVHVFRPHDDNLNSVRLLACIGDEIFLYQIPLIETSGYDIPEGEEVKSDKPGEGGNGTKGAILLGKTLVGEKYGCSVATYTPLASAQQPCHYAIAVGCENGVLVILHVKENESEAQFQKVAECHGHTKAVCAVSFHPRGRQVLSSAKDGTARVFSVESGKEIGKMECEVHDPNGPPPPKPNPASGGPKTKDPRMMKRPPQILVRGCAYGDLEGKVIYTIASGKKGAAYLTKWKTLAPLQSPPTTQTANATELLNFRPEYRIQCSPVPISATSLSPDCTLFAFGSVEGSILLYNLETQRVIKQFEGHDLPVTCIASRPVPNMLLLPGEEVAAAEGGVSVDAVSASADNRLGRWTLQKKSRKVKASAPRETRKKSALENFLWGLFKIPFYFFLVLLVLAVRDFFDICVEEMGYEKLLTDIDAAYQCCYREVLWAEETRAGVKFIPE